MKVGFFSTVCIMLAVAHTTGRVPGQKQFGAPMGTDQVQIAEVDGCGIPPENVENVLRRAGVGCITGGSMAYGVWVSKAQAASARKVLIADAKRRPYEYAFIEGYSGKLGVPERAGWTYRKLNIDLQKIHTAPELRADRNLLGLALEAQEAVRGFPELSHAKPYISGARLFPMRYTDDQGRSRSGYWGVVSVKFRRRQGAFKSYAYSWDNGTKHMGRGGGGD